MPLLRRGTAAAVAVLLALLSITTLTLGATGLAADDAYSVQEDQTLLVPSGALLGVLDNDTGGSLVLCVSTFDTTGLEGTLTTPPGVAADGSFTYTPPPNFNGTTTFTYDVATKVADVCPPPPTAEGTATVTITVTPVNDAPTAVGDSFTALKGHTLNIAAPGVLGNDSDVDGDTLTAVKKSSLAHGTVDFHSDGSFSYTPDAGYVGPDQFSYWASDGSGGATDHSPQRIVSLTVAALPPTPSPTPVVTPTPAPTASPEPSPSESPAPSDSGLASPSPSAGPPSASPSPGPVTGPVAGGGGLPLGALGALALLLGLLAVAGVFFVRSQRSGDDGEGQPGYLGGDFDDDPPGR